MRYTAEEIKAHRLAYVEALESGEYLQAQNVLTQVDETDPTRVIGHCCLGVACEVALKHGVFLNISTRVAASYDGEPKAPRVYDGESAFLPTKVIDWLGEKNSNPTMDSEEGLVTATFLNDGPGLYNFDQIAAVFRKHWGLPPKEQS